jgi:hypothetical protein
MKEWPKLWKFWLMFPAVISLFWESAPEDQKEKVKKEARKFRDWADQMFWPVQQQQPQQKQGPQVEFGDFDVLLVDTNGIGRGRTNSAVFERGENGKIEPGAYKQIVIESPSMDALKYASIATYVDLIKREKSDIRGAPKHLNVNDTIDMAFEVNLGENNIPLGKIHFKWDCE